MVTYHVWNTDEWITTPKLSDLNQATFFPRSIIEYPSISLDVSWVCMFQLWKKHVFFQQKPNPHELMRSFGKSSLLETCHFTTPKKPTAGNKYTSPVDDQNVFCLYRNQKPVPTFEPQKTFIFHYTFTDWFTGILIKAYYNAYIIA